MLRYFLQCFNCVCQAFIVQCSENTVNRADYCVKKMKLVKEHEILEWLFYSEKKLYFWFMIGIPSVSDSVASKRDSSRLLFASHKLAYSKVITCFLA